MRCLVDSKELYYCVGARTGVGIRRAHSPAPFDPYRAGLHHLCFRARSRADVDGVAAEVEGLGGTLVHAPQEDDWAPGYYSVLFEDPCGTRLEVNYVPGKGHLADEASHPLGADVQARLGRA
jgi:catechol 2,3-dioxygenase-like lactoylglutathione lyase family enzyme